MALLFERLRNKSKANQVVGHKTFKTQTIVCARLSRFGRYAANQTPTRRLSRVHSQARVPRHLQTKKQIIEIKKKKTFITRKNVQIV